MGVYGLRAYSIKVVLSRAHPHWGGVPHSAVLMEVYRMNKARVRGRYCFHRRCISWSYRNRGYEARVHKNSVVSIMVFAIMFRVNSCGFIIPGFRNMIVDKVFISRMLVYSAKNSSANGPAENSTLNPDTNSDSPSVRSNGDRLVSAKVEVNHIIASGHVGNRSHMCSCVSVNMFREYPPDMVAIETMISPRVTS